MPRMRNFIGSTLWVFSSINPEIPYILDIAKGSSGTMAMTSPEMERSVLPRQMYRSVLNSIHNMLDKAQGEE